MMKFIKKNSVRINAIFEKTFKIRIIKVKQDVPILLKNSNEIGKFISKQKVNINDIYLIPSEICTWGYGFRHLADEHPFIAYLMGNISLSGWYEQFKPNSIEKAYFLDESKNNLVKNKSIFNDPIYDEAPAFVRGRIEVTQNEYPLSIVDGIQFQGPVSHAKIELESSRLKKTYMSISKNGYLPGSYKFNGHIMGQLLKIESEYRFLILNGRHRAASLVALGYTYLPVKFYPNILPIISQDLLDDKLNISVLDSMISKKCIKNRKQIIKNSIKVD
jgi:hypothetical protein